MADVDQQYIDFFLRSPAAIMKIECLEITHSAFSRVYRVVRNVSAGVTVRHEDGQEYDYEYYPLKLENLKNSDDMDSGFSITLGDLGEIFSTEAARVLAADAGLEKPQVVYRGYRSDMLDKPMLGPLRTEVSSVPYTDEGAAFESKAPALNTHNTGEIYTLTRFPSLRGFL